MWPGIVSHQIGGDVRAPSGIVCSEHGESRNFRPTTPSTCGTPNLRPLEHLTTAGEAEIKLPRKSKPTNVVCRRVVTSTCRIQHLVVYSRRSAVDPMRSTNIPVSRRHSAAMVFTTAAAVQQSRIRFEYQRPFLAQPNASSRSPLPRPFTVPISKGSKGSTPAVR